MVQVVWKSLLEMTEALGKHRLEAADTYLTKVSEPCKPIYMSKKQISKKVRSYNKSIWLWSNIQYSSTDIRDIMNP